MKKTLLPLVTPVKNPLPRFPWLLLPLCSLLLCRCPMMTNRAPTGERFTRTNLGTTTSIASLAVESTNGVRKVELGGYQNDCTKALGAVTDAALKRL